MATPVSVSDALEGLNEATVTERYPHLAPKSQYLLRVTRCDLQNAHRSGLTYIIEHEIVQSDNPNEPVGAMRSSTITDLKGKHSKLKMGKLKNALASIGHIDPDAPIPYAGETWVGLADKCVTTDMAVGRLVLAQTDEERIAETSKQKYVPQVFKPYYPPPSE